MNKLENFAYLNNRLDLCIRMFWRKKIIERIDRNEKLQQIFEAIHTEIDPIIEQKRRNEDFLSNGFKSCAEYRDSTLGGIGYVHFYSVLLRQDNTDLSSANEPIYEAIRAVERVRKETIQEKQEISE